MRTFRKNKRGVAEEISDIAFALLFLFLGILLMTYLTKQNEKLQKVEGEYFMYEAIAANNIALYLKQPVSVDNQILTMADLIILAYEKKGKYEESWDELTTAFFSDAQKKAEITVKKQDGDSMKTTAKAEDYQEKEKLPGRNLLYNLLYPNRGYYPSISTVYLPSHDSKLEIEFKIWIKKNEAAQLALVD